MIFEVNDSGPINFTFTPYLNNTKFLEISCSVTDGTLIIMGYGASVLYGAPMLSIMEIEKL